MPNDRGTEKEDMVCVCVYIYIYIYTHTCNGMLLSHQKNEIVPFAVTWMVLEGIMLSELSQSEKDNYHMLSLICGI